MRSTVMRPYLMTCDECSFSTRDQKLMNNHSCDITSFGGNCEDFPCCGHEYGDCNGLLYGSDEAIKEQAYEHFGCDHEAGYYECVDENWED